MSPGEFPHQLLHVFLLPVVGDPQDHEKLKQLPLPVEFRSITHPDKLRVRVAVLQVFERAMTTSNKCFERLDQTTLNRLRPRLREFFR